MINQKESEKDQNGFLVPQTTVKRHEKNKKTQKNKGQPTNSYKKHIPCGIHVPLFQEWTDGSNGIYRSLI